METHQHTQKVTILYLRITFHIMDTKELGVPNPVFRPPFLSKKKKVPYRRARGGVGIMSRTPLGLSPGFFGVRELKRESQNSFKKGSLPPPPTRPLSHHSRPSCKSDGRRRKRPLPD